MSVSLVADDEVLENFAEDVGLLWCSGSGMIARLENPPTALQFCRDFISQSRPCIIQNAMLQQEKHETGHDNNGGSRPLHLSLSEIEDRMPADALITVDVTPDGHGDCIRTTASDNIKRFVKPHEQKMTISEFRRYLEKSNGRMIQEKGILSDVEVVDGASVTQYDPEGQPGNLPEQSAVYYSRQSDCLRQEFQPIQEMFPPTIAWAEQAIGTGPPDAINLWIGNQSVISSMHKDHYENLFYVLEGEKIFTLCPPSDAPFLYENEFLSGTFACRGDGTWQLTTDADETRVRWIEPNVDTLLPNADPLGRTNTIKEFPLLKYTHPVQVRVKQGEMLYLPSLWFHQVTQSCETIGINYWFDMKFDSPNWCYFHLLQQLKLSYRSHEGVEALVS